MTRVEPVGASEPDVARLVTELTDELAASGYTEEETFGYSLQQLEARGVHLVGGYEGAHLVGIGGIEVQGETAELKRFYVSPGHRGSGVADAMIHDLLAQARARGVGEVRLETGDRQHAAMAFYRRHGFVEIPRFGPYACSATSVCFSLRL